MKRIRSFLVYLILFFFVFKLFSYQIQEKYLVSASLNTFPHETDISGHRSSIMLIKDLRQFAMQVVNNPKPVVVKLFSNDTADNKMIFVYQSIADQIGEEIFFASINVDLSYQLKLLLQRILNFNNTQLPLIIFFKHGQMILPAFSGIATEENLFKLIKTRFGKRLVKVDKQTLKKVKSKQKSVVQPKKVSKIDDGQIVLKDKNFELRDEKPKEIKHSSFFEKIKKFFQN